MHASIYALALSTARMTDFQRRQRIYKADAVTVEPMLHVVKNTMIKPGPGMKNIIAH